MKKRFRIPTAAIASAALALGLIAGAGARAATLAGTPPLIVSHRGASGYLPEETMEAYRLAAALQADYLEGDVYLTRDGVPVMLHDGTLNATTNVVAYAAAHPDIQALESGPEGKRVYDVTDFTFDQLRQLTATCRAAAGYCSDGTHYDSGFAYRLISLEQLADFVYGRYLETGRAVGLYPETKQGGTAVADAILKVLQNPKYQGYFAPERRTVILQSFDAGQLHYLRTLTRLPLVQLGACPATPEAAQAIKAYADGIGPSLRRTTAECVAAAHSAGLFVHPYTFLDDPAQYAMFYRLGVDGVFTNFADIARAAIP